MKTKIIIEKTLCDRCKNEILKNDYVFSLDDIHLCLDCVGDIFNTSIKNKIKKEDIIKWIENNNENDCALPIKEDKPLSLKDL